MLFHCLAGLYQRKKDYVALRARNHCRNTRYPVASRLACHTDGRQLGALIISRDSSDRSHSITPGKATYRLVTLMPSHVTRLVEGGRLRWPRWSGRGAVRKTPGRGATKVILWLDGRLGT